MTFKQKLAEATGIKADRIPASYQIIGDVLLMKMPKLKQKEKQKIAASILVLLPYVKTVCEMKEVKGELREPVVIAIAGNGTITTHKENDVLYRIDAAKIMFSKGNLSERKRLIEHVKEGETIIDMFAGIGYFSLPIAKFTKAKEIFSIEKNPTSYHYLTENIALNKISNIIAIQGDCNIAARTFGNRADRIIMGYFPGTESFLPAAFWMAKSGCMIHFHNVYTEKELWKVPAGQIKHVSEAFKKDFEIIAKKKVKSVGPRKWHVVVDFRVL
ncbi:MAG: class I SAM-dependent methyltransferase family protein [Candidatus Aenigmarchaeota archaeon]|nr:class I SAM-dependent methyltransferase family protein [Candidatus Aenigmarchaeota archaeon]